MKFVLSVIVTVGIFLSTSMSVLALDIDCGGGPEEYLTTYLDNRDYSILQVTVLETIETSQSSHAFEAGLYDRVSQRVAVNQVLQGTATSIEWLYFDMDPIWGYSCQNGHVADGESAIERYPFLKTAFLRYYQLIKYQYGKAGI